MKKHLFFEAICFITFCFWLYPLSHFAQSTTFIHITDTHVSDVDPIVNTADINGTMAACYLKEFATYTPLPKFVLCSGDVSNVGNNSSSMYYVFTQFLYPHPSPINPAVGDFFIDSAKTIPIYFCPGNHDYYTTLYPPGSLTQANNLPNYVQSVAPDTDYAIISSYYVILMVRSGYDIPYWDELDMFTPDGSGITDAQCSWIRSQLKENSTKRKIIVMHHPVTNIDGTNCDGTAFTTTIPEVSSGSIANNRQTLLNICDSNNVDIMLTGHQHQNVVTDLNGNIVAENCTTCGTRYVQTGAAFNGCYRVITVTPTFVTVSIPLESCVATSVREKYAYSIDVYPNPAIDDILVDTYVKSSIEIYNTNGQLIYNTYSDGTPFNVDVSRYPKGIYLIKVVGETGMIVKSFAKE